MPACTCPPAECSHATTSFAWGEEGPECSKLQILLPPSWLSVSTDVAESTPRPPAPASVTSEIPPGAQGAEQREAVGCGHSQKGTTGTHVSVMGAAGGWNATWPFPSLSLSFPPRKRKASPCLCAFFPSVPPAAAHETPSQATPSPWQRAENEQMVLGGRSPMEGEQHSMRNEHPGDGDVILRPRRDVCTVSPWSGPAGWGAQTWCPPSGVAPAETHCSQLGFLQLQLLADPRSITKPHPTFRGVVRHPPDGFILSRLGGADQTQR